MKATSRLHYWRIHALDDGREYASGVCGDHYRLPPRGITTSEIVARGPGWIETRNTHYVLGEPAPEYVAPPPREAALPIVATFKSYPDYADPNRKPPTDGDGIDEIDEIPSWLDDDQPTIKP